MPVRLPRPTRRTTANDTNTLTPTFDRDLARVQSRKRGTVTLYRGERVKSHRTGGLRRLRRVEAGQSWSTNRNAASRFAIRNMSGGKAGLVYAIEVPAAELSKARVTNATASNAFHEAGGQSGGGWAVMRDLRHTEFRPDADRPELRPKIVRTTMSSPIGNRLSTWSGVTGGG